MKPKTITIVFLVLLAVIACTPRELYPPSEETASEAENVISRDDSEDNSGEGIEEPSEGSSEGNPEDTHQEGQDIVLADEDYIQTGMPDPTEEVDKIRLGENDVSIRDAFTKEAFMLLTGLYDDKSIVISPLSLQLALSVLANGSNGATLEELLTFLGADYLDDLNDYNRILTDLLPAVDLSAVVKVANALIVSDELGVQQSYRERIEKEYYAAVACMDFSDFDYVKAVVNEWCYRNTEGLIPYLLDDQSAEAVAYLLNALYFKSEWTSPFHETDVRKDLPFYSYNGVVNVDYLVKREHLNYFDSDGFCMVSRPFGKKKLFEISFILPEEGLSVTTISPELSTQWTDVRCATQWTDVILRFPRIHTESYFSLKETLEGMGLQNALSPLADYSGIFLNDADVAISNVYQKAVFSLDENGAEAAAVTEFDYGGSSTGEEEDPVDPVEFTLDHPFIYLISEKSSGIILFTGIFDGQ